jgi:Concanavalin A-like lectin/glucanases superfamily
MLCSFRRQFVLIVCAWVATNAACPADNSGPYNLTFLEGGIGMSRPLAADNPTLPANASWSITGWVRPTLGQSGDVVVAAVGDTTITSCRCLMLHDGKLQIRAGGFEVSAPQPTQIGNWYALAATYDGESLRLYIDGQPVGIRQVTKQLPAVSPTLALAPPAGDPDQHFGGSIAQLQLEAGAVDAQRVQHLYDNRPNFPLVVFQNAGTGWPFQEHAWRGLLVPQDPWTLPGSNTPPARPVAAPDAPTSPLQASGDNTWTVGAWRLAEAPNVRATGTQLSTAQFDATNWYPAVVPGTVLTTLIARGVFDVTEQLEPGQPNTLAVRVSPPPHPGIPHEESIAAGPGGNGGNLALDGPTFIATEGWDWIPGIRDRNTGIWQDVQLNTTGALRLLDPHVVTHLPLPKTDQADISIEVAVENHHSTPTQAVVEAHLEGMTVKKSVILPPGITKVDLTPDLHINKPRLWWPNGYGSPAGAVSDHPRQRGTHCHTGRKLGHRRSVEARIPRATRALLPAAPGREPQHHPQLVGSEHGRGVL